MYRKPSLDPEALVVESFETEAEWAGPAPGPLAAAAPQTQGEFTCGIACTAQVLTCRVPICI